MVTDSRSNCPSVTGDKDTFLASLVLEQLPQMSHKKQAKCPKMRREQSIKEATIDGVG